MWAQALTAVSSVEDEAARVVQKAQTVAGWSQDEVRRQVDGAGPAAADAAPGAGAGCGERGPGCAPAAAGSHGATRSQALTAQVERMAARVERLEQGSA